MGIAVTVRGQKTGGALPPASAESAGPPKNVVPPSEPTMVTLAPNR